MPTNSRHKHLAEAIASTICEDFADYNREFRTITRRAPNRFENRDWKGSQRDAVERIELYDIVVKRTAIELKHRLGQLCKNKTLWAAIKACFAEKIRRSPDPEFYKTFFSSITRHLFDTVGVDMTVEFLAVDFEPTPPSVENPKTRTYSFRTTEEQLFSEILNHFAFATPFCKFDDDIHFITNEVSAYRNNGDFVGEIIRIEIMEPVFHQLTRAYLVGRLIGTQNNVPLIISLVNGQEGIAVDAVMMAENEAGMLFSFTRSYFHVDLEQVAESVAFLRLIMPEKSAGELYTVLGRAKQGKTVRYRNLLDHLKKSNDQFVHAPGDKGLVMMVLTLPSYDIVIKIIRDHFAPPKTSSRQDVLHKYQLVFKHDRAGRLIDAQEFTSLTFESSRFSQAVLDELISEATESVKIQDNKVILKHCYIERRLTPLNLYLQTATNLNAQKAVYDYGQAIRDLALSNIFPGDLLSKNFGVTRYGRVIFYDYDELCMVTDCNFREMPVAETIEDEMRSETWFYVGENDVFPEQFISFLGFGRELEAFFMEWHSDIMTAHYWRDLQNQHRLGQVLDVLPYHRYPSVLRQA